MPDDYLGSALDKIDREKAARQAAAEGAVEWATTAHPHDPELHALLVGFATRMPHDSAIPFIEERIVQDPAKRRFGKSKTPSPRREAVVRAHGWVLWGLGGRDVYLTRPPNAGAMGRLALGVTVDAEPMFILKHIQSQQLPYQPITSVRVGQFDFYERDLSDSPLCARELGPIAVENKCGAILETLRLRYDDKSVAPVETQYSGSATVFRHWPPAADQAEELLTEMGRVMAEMIRA